MAFFLYSKTGDLADAKSDPDNIKILISDAQPANSIPVATGDRRHYKVTGTAPNYSASIDSTRQTAANTEDLQTAKDAKKRLIEAVYNSKLSEDFTYSSNVYQMDLKSQQRISHGLNYINAGAASIDWTLKNNNRITLTPTQFKNMAKAAFERGQGHFVTMKTKKDAVDALTTIAAVNSYDETAGW